MPDWLLDRSTVIALAIAGGVFSILASCFQSWGWATKPQVQILNKVAYALMAASILLFICAGFFGSAGQAG